MSTCRTIHLNVFYILSPLYKLCVKFTETDVDICENSAGKNLVNLKSIALSCFLHAILRQSPHLNQTSVFRKQLPQIISYTQGPPVLPNEVNNND